MTKIRSRQASRRLLRVSTTVAVACLTALPAAGFASAVPLRSAGSAAPASVVNAWLPTGPMSVNRSGQTATLLPSGVVLVAGGGTATAELYDPASRTFVPTGSMSVSRTDATATLLPDGDVLVAGGRQGFSKQLSSAELYDPGSGTWSPTGAMNTARSGQTATLLPDGDVLVAGGGCNKGGGNCDSGSFLNTLASAELYDPATGSWSKTGHMRSGRQFFTATLLGDGMVLATGGFVSCDDDFCSDARTAELYDPSTGSWAQTGSMKTSREQHTATLLAGGEVLVAGGLRDNSNGGSAKLAEAEIYNPTTGTWSVTAAMEVPRAGHTATLLHNGWVLVAGGRTSGAEIYEPSRGVWVATSRLNTRRTDHTATLLPDGEVLVTGGGVATAETYQPGRGPLVTLAPALLDFGAQQAGSTSSALTFTVANLGNADLRVSGVTLSGAHPGDFIARTTCSSGPVAPGTTCSVTVQFAPSATGLRKALVGVVDNAPLDPQTEPVSGFGEGPDVWAPTGPMSVAREDFAAVRLGNGMVLVAGGEAADLDALKTAELYDPTSRQYTSTGSLEVARSYVSATALPNGKVLVAGGLDVDTRLSSAELYSPKTGTWSLTGSMHEVGDALTSTLLPNGKVLVTGLGDSSDAEVYNPRTGRWTDTGPMVGDAFFGTATLLPNGLVLAAGGDSTVAGLYDPATNTWTATGSMLVARQDPTATLLPNGEVLVAGGSVPDAGGALASAELYDPTTGTWTLTSNNMSVARTQFTATLLTTGQVLVEGGCTSECDEDSVTASSEIYNTASGFWDPAAPMTTAREAARATLLSSGDVLVSGGGDYCCNVFDSSEVYTPTLLFDHPTSGPVGQQVRLRGSGFFAFETVRLTWDFQPLAAVRTTRNGTFSVTVTVPSADPGSYPIDASGKASFARAETTFLVTGPP